MLPASIERKKVSKKRKGRRDARGRTKNNPRLELHHLKLVFERTDEALPVTAPNHASRDLLIWVETFLYSAHQLRATEESQLKPGEGEEGKETNRSNETLRESSLSPYLAQPFSSNVLTRSTRHLLPPRRRHVCSRRKGKERKEEEVREQEKSERREGREKNKETHRLG
jgi:hypothetical protein